MAWMACRPNPLAEVLERGAEQRMRVAELLDGLDE
jgi:hypothetical protein